MTEMLDSIVLILELLLDTIEALAELQLILPKPQ